MKQNYLLNHWYSNIYEQQVIQADEIQYILSAIGNSPKNVLEVACGGGRIMIPVARMGHTVTGFDFDEYMLEKIPAKAKSLKNLSFYKSDAITEDWGTGFDVVILAGNILLNIVADINYMQAQKLFIKKAADCVKQGGHLYLDFDCYDRPDQADENQSEWVCFEGIDNLGTHGKYIVISGEYDSNTRIDKSYRRYEITPKDGKLFSVERTVTKHFPSFEQVKSWLEKAGWEIENAYGSYEKRPINEKLHGNRAIIWARKI